jgi:heme A synthase
MQATIFLHSLLRYFVLLFALIVVIQSLSGVLGKKRFSKKDKTGALLLLIFCDVQLLIGLAIYAMGGWAHVISAPGAMKDTYSRFYGMEHGVSMIIAIILVHIGYSFAKKNMDDMPKFKRIFWCSFIALCIFFAMIPWQNRQVIGKPNIPTLSAN